MGGESEAVDKQMEIVVARRSGVHVSEHGRAGAYERGAMEDIGKHISASPGCLAYVHIKVRKYRGGMMDATDDGICSVAQGCTTNIRETGWGLSRPRRDWANNPPMNTSSLRPC